MEIFWIFNKYEKKKSWSSKLNPSITLKMTFISRGVLFEEVLFGEVEA
jgi:hypothetical protein